MTDRGAQHGAAARPRLRLMVTALFVLLVALQLSGCVDPGALASSEAGAVSTPVGTHQDGGTDGVCSPGPSAASTPDRTIAALPQSVAAPVAAMAGPRTAVAPCSPAPPATSGRALLAAIGVSRT